MKTTASAGAPRLLSLDALRGFDMLWIIGGDAIVAAAHRRFPTPWLGALETQLRHVRWEGLHALDLIFPLFMFLSGVAIPYALDDRRTRGELTRAGALRKAARRALTLLLLGAVYNGALASDAPPRLASVLGQIGAGYLVASAAHLLVPSARARFALLLALLAGVSGAQLLFPGAGEGLGPLTPSGSINAWLDSHLLPGRLYAGDHDPEGLFCALSACTLTLAGALTGAALRRECARPALRAALLGAAGAAFLAAGHAAWACGYPPIKNLWTGTFDALAIGWSLIAFSAFHAVIDVAGFKAWSLPLRVIGANCLAVYLAAEIVGFGPASRFLFGRVAGLSGAPELVLACGVLALEWLALAWLWRRRLFLAV